MASDPAEVARIAVQQQRASRIADAAAQLRDQAQAEYDALVAAQQQEMADHQAAVTSHIDRVRDLSQQLSAFSPKLDVAYWTAAATQQVAAAEAQGG